MKKHIFFLTLFLSFLKVFGQENSYSLDSILSFQKQLNALYADSTRSPLLENDLKNFTSLDFFDPSPKYFVKATLIRTLNEKPFNISTSTELTRTYIKYGELHFTIDGKALKLNAYLPAGSKAIYSKNLFIPFTDFTSGISTYGGGRYIDLPIPNSDTIYLDFNKAYHPYCAYNYKYSCPIPPPENDLEIEIKAGVRLANKEK